MLHVEHIYIQSHLSTQKRSCRTSESILLSWLVIILKIFDVIL